MEALANRRTIRITVSPTPDPILLIQRSDRAKRTRELYTSEMAHFVRSGASLTDPHALQAHAETLSDGRRRTFRSTVNLWARQVCRHLDDQVTPETWIEFQATKDRLRSLAGTIEVTTPKGSKAHTWLSRAQVQGLYQDVSGDDVLSCRDRVVLGLMLVCGLRRDEVRTLRWSDLIRQPADDGDVVTILNVLGKGSKRRPVPITRDLERDLDTWADRSGRDGYIVRVLGRSLDVRGGDKPISTVSIHNIVRKYGTRIGLPELACHDLRRTAAQTWYAATKDVVLVSRLLGHASVETTQRYLEISTTNAVEVINATAWNTESD